MEFDNFDPNANGNIGFRNLDVEYAYNIYRLNRDYFGIDIKDKLFSKSQPYNILLNQFPYYWKNSVHYIFWVNPKYENFYNYNRIVEIIINTFKNKTIKYWENDIINRSIPSIRHIHIIQKI